MVKLLLNNSKIRQLLEKETFSEGYTSLDFAIPGGNVEIIKEILKYPEGRNLLNIEGSIGRMGCKF